MPAATPLMPEQEALTALNSKLFHLQQRMVSAPRSERKALRLEVTELDEKVRKIHEKYRAGNVHAFGTKAYLSTFYSM